MQQPPAAFWQRAPRCFACGKEIGANPDDVIYVGYGHRAQGSGPGWVASLCACRTEGEGPHPPWPCLEATQAFAAEDGVQLSAEQYQTWLASA